MDPFIVHVDGTRGEILKDMFADKMWARLSL